MKTKEINTASFKKALFHAYGIKARRVAKYTAGTISVFVASEDIAKAKAAFESFGIKRQMVDGLVLPFEVNGGEFNSLVWIDEQ
jgi:hypothetical protein